MFFTPKSSTIVNIFFKPPNDENFSPHTHIECDEYQTKQLAGYYHFNPPTLVECDTESTLKLAV